MMKGFIYITTNNVNNLKYIGKKYYFDRNGKKTNWEHYLGSSKILKEDIKKYGKEFFSREIIDEADNEYELSKLECYYINSLSAVESPYFYNLSNGIDKWYTTSEGIKKSLETRKKWGEEKKKKVSEKLKNRYQNLTEEEKKERSLKISKSIKNNTEFKEMRSRVQKKVIMNTSPEKQKSIREKQRNSMKKYHNNLTPEGKKRFVDERREGLKRSRAQLIKNAIERRKNKNIILKNIESGEIYEMNLLEAEKFLGCSKSILSKLFHGNYNKKNTWKKWTTLK